jgi:hypothetical protein
MSQPRPAARAKLVIGFLVHDRTLAGWAVEELGQFFGSLDLVSPWLPFDFTDYYAREMGTPLYRRLVAYKRLVKQDKLPDIKHVTNRIEVRGTRQGRRRVNIDPGILLRERFVLATGKNFTHRVYLGRGIYADLTLIYRQGAFHTLPWTYPDYADTRHQAFLLQARRKLQRDIKETDRAGHGNASGHQPKGSS